MSVVRKFAVASLITAGALAISAAAQAGPAVTVTPNGLGDTTSSAPDTAHNCFYLSQWQGWRSPKPDVIYLRVRIKDIYQVDLSHGTSLLQSPFAHLVSRQHGDDSVCNPIDLNLSVAEDHGISEPLFPKSITKLTPQQIAAIPATDLP